MVPEVEDDFIREAVLGRKTPVTQIKKRRSQEIREKLKTSDERESYIKSQILNSSTKRTLMPDQAVMVDDKTKEEANIWHKKGY